MTLAAIGWTVVHSLWQWTLVGGVAALILGLLRDARPHTRYVIGCASLALMIALSVATASTAILMIEAPIRHRALYAFDGALLMPEVFDRGLTVLRFAGVLWSIGVVVGLARLSVEGRCIRQLRATANPHCDRVLSETLESVRAAVGVQRPVVVCHSERIAVPMVVGWRRPRILLPAHATQSLTEDQTRGVLAHELGHVRREDFFVNVVQAIVDVLAFHHPAARWVSRGVRTEREYACDDLAVAATNDAASYARALAALEDARSEHRLVVAGASGTLLDRVQRIVGQRHAGVTSLRGVLICVVALFVGAALFVVGLNMPPPWLPEGIRMRRPPPRAPRPVAQSYLPELHVGFPLASRSVSLRFPDVS